MKQTKQTKQTKQVIIGSKKNKYTFFGDDVLGRGAYGTVYKGIETHTNREVAIKAIGDVPFPKKKEKYIEVANREITVFKLINDCANVVKMIDFAEDVDYTYIIMEYCDGKDLRKIIKKKHRLKEEEAVKCLRDIAKGVYDLHQKNIMHRDLNLGNILVKEGRYVLADLGSAIQKKESGDFAGAAGYTAPEILLTNQGGKYNKQVDIWAMGVIFFKIVYGKDVYKEYQKALSEDDTTGVKRFPKNPNVSKDAVDLLDKMFKIDPNERITIEGVVNHRLLNKDGGPVGETHEREVEEEKIEEVEEVGEDENEEAGDDGEEEVQKEQPKEQKNKGQQNEQKESSKKKKKQNKKKKKNTDKSDPPVPAQKGKQDIVAQSSKGNLFNKFWSLGAIFLIIGVFMSLTSVINY